MNTQIPGINMVEPHSGDAGSGMWHWVSTEVVPGSHGEAQGGCERVLPASVPREDPRCVQLDACPLIDI